jgi:TRAP-type C4-dicarboxylate transport system permease small subunit
MATSRHDPNVQKATTPSLFAAVIDDARELAIGHLERMQRETKQELSNLKTAIARTAVGVAILIVGTILAGHAIAAVMIALGLLPWASYLITAVLAVGGGIFLLSRWPKNSTDMDLVPEQAIEAMKRDLQSVKEATQSA